MSLNHRTAAGAGLFVSLALVIGVPSGWALTRSTDAGVGSLPVTSAAPSISPSPSTTGPAASASPSGPSATSPYRIVPTAPVLPMGPRPTRFSAPSLGISAAVDPVGVDASGAVAIPANAYRLGWYQFGAAPGDPIGSAVLVGHRDSRTQGKGALYALDGLGVGDPLIVTRANGTTVRYRVVERRLYLKVGLPVDTFFGRSGAPRLTVITCGGPYDRSRGGYQDNLVVTAVPDGGKS